MTILLINWKKSSIPDVTHSNNRYKRHPMTRPEKWTRRRSLHFEYDWPPNAMHDLTVTCTCAWPVQTLSSLTAINNYLATWLLLLGWSSDLYNGINYNGIHYCHRNRKSNILYVWQSMGNKRVVFSSDKMCMHREAQSRDRWGKSRRGSSSEE